MTASSGECIKATIKLALASGRGGRECYGATTRPVEAPSLPGFDPDLFSKPVLKLTQRN